MKKVRLYKSTHNLFPYFFHCKPEWLLMTIVITAFLFTSCDPVKRVEKLKEKICPLCDTKDTVIQKDSVLTFLQDTVINQVFPHDTIYVHIPIQQYKEGYYLIKRTSSKFCIAELWMNGKELLIRTSLKDTSMPYVLEKAKEKIIYWQYKAEHNSTLVPVYKEKIVKHIPHVYLISFWILIVGLIGGVVYLITKTSNITWFWIKNGFKLMVSLFKKKAK